MNLSEINKSVVSNHVEEKLKLPPPKEEQSIMAKEKEKLKSSTIGDFYSKESKQETKQYKQVSSSSTSGYYSGSSSSYYSSGSSYKSSTSSKVGMYGGANLNYNDRINRIRKKSKEIAKQNKATKGNMIPFEGEYNFSLKKGRVKMKKKKLTNKQSKVAKQVGVAVLTICLEVSLGVLIASSKSEIEQIATEVKGIFNKEVIKSVK